MFKKSAKPEMVTGRLVDFYKKPHLKGECFENNIEKLKYA
jgi:hypothetical protein